MTATIMRSKKFNFANKLGLICSVFLLSTALYAETQRLPVMQNVGLIPVQFENFAQNDSATRAFQNRVQSVYQKVVRRAHRFNVLNDELVGGLWANAEGRAELHSQYELHAFVSLSLSERGDVISAVARLMDPRLNILLSESSNTNAGILRTSREDELAPQLSDLFFRLFNRLPIDVTITSVQGRYITLSGGETQGMRLGETVQIVRPFVDSTHSADGTWLSFKNEKIGEAEVVELKKTASVARLVALNYEDAAQVGDGIKAEHLAARGYFARGDEEPEFKDSKEEIVVPTLQNGKPVKNKRQVEKIPNIKPQPKAEGEEVPNEPAGEVESEAPQEKIEAQEEKSAVTDESPDEEKKEDDARENEGKDLFLMSALSELFNTTTVSVGPRLWSASGDASAAAAFPPWLFNFISVEATGRLTPSLNYDVFSDFEFGRTADSNYTGFGGGGIVYIAKKMSLIPGIEFWRAGGLGKFESRAIANETFGGGDILSFGVIGGVGGRAKLMSFNIDWRTDLYFLMFGFGQMGIKGTKETVNSVFGYGLKGDVFFARRPKVVEWGGSLKLGSDKLTSPESQMTLSETTLLLNARYRF